MPETVAPDKGVAGTAETVNDVDDVTLVTKVLAANAPEPAVTETSIPAVRPVVLPIVIIDPDDDAVLPEYVPRYTCCGCSGNCKQG